MNADPSRKRRGRPKTTDRKRILDVTMDAYWTGDPAEVSVNSICEQCEVSKPSLYREFGSEDGLRRAVLDQYADEVVARILAILRSEEDFSGKLDALIRFACDDELAGKGCLFVKMRSDRHRYGQETLAGIAQIETKMLSAFGSFLRRGRQRGEWRGALSITVASRYLVAQIGLALSQMADGEDPAAVKAMLETALSVFRP
jgi:AcrR family transcriptional regulator